MPLLVEINRAEYEKLIKSGELSRDELATKLYTSRQSLGRWERSNGIKPYRKRAIRESFTMDVETYLELSEEGLTHEEKAKRLYISPATLSRWKKKNGITDYRSPEEYKALRNQGYRDYQIAQRWGITKNGLYRWKRAYNLVGYQP